MPYLQIICAVAIAFSQPVLFVVVRHGVRLGRLRALYEFDQLFDVSKPIDEPEHVREGTRPAPTYEYVRARYTDDIEFPDDFEPDWIRTFDMGAPRFRAFIRRLRWWHLKSSWNLLGASLPLTMMVTFGLLVLFLPPSIQSGFPLRIHNNPFDLERFASPLLVTAGLADGPSAAILARNVTVVAEAAFVGAYVFTLMLFLRALATFDFSPLTVVRGTSYFVVGIVGAVMLYIGFQDLPSEVASGAQGAVAAVSGMSKQSHAPAAPSPPQSRPAVKTSDIGGAVLIPAILTTDNTRASKTLGAAAMPPSHDQKGGTTAGQPAGAPKQLSWIWVVFAFMLGFTPDLSINAMTSLVQRTFKIKTTDDRLLDANKSTPLELLDGIDVLTRFRLQEANIFEVQNLAVVNPVMLFIETPYGIYEVIDWVAQAQLCMSVGPDRFVELQRRSIRTIFDLERAVLSAYTTRQFRRYIASILLASPLPTPSSQVSVRAFSGVSPTPGPGLPPRDSAAFDTAVGEFFSQNAIASDGVSPAPDPDETIKHLVRTMVDDLHVCRLRQVWHQIMAKIDGVPPGNHSSDRLWDTEWQPPLPPAVQRPRYYGR